MIDKLEKVDWQRVCRACRFRPLRNRSACPGKPWGIWRGANSVCRVSMAGCAC